VGAELQNKTQGKREIEYRDELRSTCANLASYDRWKPRFPGIDRKRNRALLEDPRAGGREDSGIIVRDWGMMRKISGGVRGMV